MKKITFIQFLIVIMAGFFGEMSTDIYIPNLPAIATIFGVDYAATGMTITVNLIGFSLSCIIFGTISDYKGRKVSLLAGMVVFCVASFLCAFSGSLTELIILRFIQGFGAGSTNSIGMAIINDTCTGNKRLKMISTFGAATALSPAIAPIIASVMVSNPNGWRISFFIVTVCTLFTLICVAFKLPETTKHTSIHKKIDFSLVLASFLRALEIRDFIIFTSMQCLLFMGIWIFIAELPYIFSVVLGFPMKYYGYAVALDIGLYIFGAYLNQKFIDVNGPKKNLFIGLVFNIVLGMISLILVLLDKSHLLIATLVFFVSHIGVAFVLSNNAAIATHGHKDISGMLSSFVISLSLIAGALGIWAFGLLSFDPMISFLVAGVVTSILQVIIFLAFAKPDEPLVTSVGKSGNNFS